MWRCISGLFSNLLCYWICLFLRPGVTWKQINLGTVCWAPFHHHPPPAPFLYVAQPENSLEHSPVITCTKWSYPVTITTSLALSAFCQLVFSFHFSLVCTSFERTVAASQQSSCAPLSAACTPLQTSVHHCRRERSRMASCQERRQTAISPLRRNLANKCVDFQIMPSFSLSFARYTEGPVHFCLRHDIRGSQKQKQVTNPRARSSWACLRAGLSQTGFYL